ncbi:hypothetical protein TWF594_011413 [Orbilia oligospora]|nr:hypothetical protein TWF594_011413 [Orbilia oligospora]
MSLSAFNQEATGSAGAFVLEAKFTTGRREKGIYPMKKSRSVSQNRSCTSNKHRHHLVHSCQIGVVPTDERILNKSITQLAFLEVFLEISINSMIEQSMGKKERKPHGQRRNFVARSS